MGEEEEEEEGGGGGAGDGDEERKEEEGNENTQLLQEKKKKKKALSSIKSSSLLPHLSVIYGEKGIDWMDGENGVQLVEEMSILVEESSSEHHPHNSTHFNKISIGSAGHLLFLDEPQRSSLAIKKEVIIGRNT